MCTMCLMLHHEILSRVATRRCIRTVWSGAVLRWYTSSSKEKETSFALKVHEKPRSRGPGCND